MGVEGAKTSSFRVGGSQKKTVVEELKIRKSKYLRKKKLERELNAIKRKHS